MPRVVPVFPAPEWEIETHFSIDEDDFLSLHEIMLQAPGRYTYAPVNPPSGYDISDDISDKLVSIHYGFVPWWRRSAIQLFQYTLDLKWALYLTEREKDIRVLVDLDLLKLHRAGIAGLTRYCVHHESIDFPSGFPELPEEFGGHTHLVHLNLSGSTMTSLPPSIGRLCNLQSINLSETTRLSNLPEEIGDLASLTVMRLYRSSIQSLPNSIGRLLNLESLYLSYCNELQELPNEIGDLANLDTLGLSRASKLKKVPVEIGNLSNLRCLYSTHTYIAELPGSMERMGNLKLLRIGGHKFPEIASPGEDRIKYLLALIHSLPSLGCLGMYKIKLDETEQRKVRQALACNRARNRMGFWRTDLGRPRFASNLWPDLLDKPEYAFDIYDDINDPYGFNDVCRPDATYQLLLDGRESFLQLLIHRASLGGKLDPTKKRKFVPN